MGTRAETAAHELERRILSGEYDVGAQLPPEADLAASLAVSRTTLRDSVGRLVAQGLLRREQGRGTFVRARSGIRIPMLLEANLSISDMIRDMGLTPATSAVTASLIVPPEEVAMALGQPDLAEVILVRRLRTAGGVPAVYSDDYLLLHPGLPTSSGAFWGSLYELLNRHYGLPVTSGHARLRAGIAGPDLAAKFQIRRGDPLLILSQAHQLSDGRTVMYSDVYLRNDVFSLYVRRGVPERHGDGPGDAAPVGQPTADPLQAVAEQGGGV